MKILITGGDGYIGENLQLIGNATMIGCEFDVCDYGVHVPDLPLAHQLSYEDICRYDGIVHLAALSGIAACEKDHMKAVQENILTAMNVFRLARIRGIPVVFTSSQAAKTPKSSTYAMMKWTCETMAEINNQAGGMNYVIRLANVYGGHEYLEKKQTCVKQFITNYNSGNPLVVHGNGEQKRDFIHVYDVCNAILKCIMVCPDDKSPMDIGTGIGTSIMDVVKMFPRVRNHHYEFKKTRNVGTDSSIADVSVAKKRIGFKAKKKIEDYIKEMI